MYSEANRPSDKHTLFVQALVGTPLIFISIEVITSCCVRIISILAALFASVRRALAFCLVGLLFRFLVGLDKVTHVNDVLSSIGAPSEK
jgi:hypothetical protein